MEVTQFTDSMLAIYVLVISLQTVPLQSIIHKIVTSALYSVKALSGGV